MSKFRKSPKSIHCDVIILYLAYFIFTVTGMNAGVCVFQMAAPIPTKLGIPVHLDPRSVLVNSRLRLANVYDVDSVRPDLYTVQYMNVTDGQTDTALNDCIRDTPRYS